MDKPVAENDRSPVRQPDRYGSNGSPIPGLSSKRLRRASRSLTEYAKEVQWLLPVVGAVAGALLALVVGLIPEDPDASAWAVTVDQARGTLMGWLSIVFAGFAIVLAVASLTIQNVISRFSLRMLRLYQRQLRDRFMVAAFAMTATYILLRQFQLRSQPGDALAPAIGFSVAVALLVFTGATMIWYITTNTEWFRVDKTARRAAVLTLRTARSVERSHSNVEPATQGFSQRPPDATSVDAPASGYLGHIDTDELLGLALTHDVNFVIDRRGGIAVVRGEPIGWMTSDLPPPGDPPPPAGIAKAIDVTEARTLDEAVGYGIVVLVDIAIMALSPAVNDPNTAVQVIEEMMFMFPELARIRLGAFARTDSDGRQRVVIMDSTFGDYVKMGTDQIVLYGSEDPVVIEALLRLVRVLEALDLEGVDRQAVDSLASRVRAIVQPIPSDDHSGD